jgi:hypothetical protein
MLGHEDNSECISLKRAVFMESFLHSVTLRSEIICRFNSPSERGVLKRNTAMGAVIYKAFVSISFSLYFWSFKGAAVA